MPVADADEDEEDEDEVEEEEDGGAVVLDEDVREGEVEVLVDVNGFEKVVAMDVGNVRDVLVDASAQNCSAMDSTEERSPEHCAETQVTSCEAKLVELKGRSVDARAEIGRFGAGKWADGIMVGNGRVHQHRGKKEGMVAYFILEQKQSTSTRLIHPAPDTARPKQLFAVPHMSIICAPARWVECAYRIQTVRSGLETRRRMLRTEWHSRSRTRWMRTPKRLGWMSPSSRSLK